MNKLLGLIVSLAVGAGAAYMLDPERGRHRRALARDKAVAATNRMSEALEGKETSLGESRAPFSRRGARPRRPRPSRRAERLRPGAEAGLTAAPADRTQRGRLAWSASTEATLAVTRTPVGTCRYSFGPCALLSGPSTPVIMNCACG